MRLFFWLLAFFFVFYQCACIPVAAPKAGEIVIEDCITQHLKVLVRKNEILLTPEFYDRVVDACKTVHTGRP